MDAFRSDQSTLRRERDEVGAKVQAATDRAKAAERERDEAASALAALKEEHRALTSQQQKLQADLKSSEAKKQELAGTTSTLTSTVVSVNSKLDKLMSLPAVDYSLLQSVLASSSAGPGYSSPRLKKFSSNSSPGPISRARTFTSDHDLRTERRRRSHVSSPSIHALPSSRFYGGDGEMALGGGISLLTGDPSPPAAAAAAADDAPAPPAADAPAPPAPPPADIPEPSHEPKKAAASAGTPSRVLTRSSSRSIIRPAKSTMSGAPRSKRPEDSESEALWSLVCEPQPVVGNTVAVAVRVRPFNTREKDMGCDYCVSMSGKSIALEEPTSKEKTTFTFDYIFNTTDPALPDFADQPEVFKSLGIDILRNAWEGYNACLFAYGQTGSGKSWSITGSKENPGIIPLFCDKLFYFIDHHMPEHTTIAVECSFLEIYNERVQDLLNPDGCNLKVREHPITGVFVEGLSFCAAEWYAGERAKRASER
jgi:hypothetical protein